MKQQGDIVWVAVNSWVSVLMAGWKNMLDQRYLPVSSYIYVSAVCIKAGIWWRTDYVYYDTIPYLFKFTALIYMHHFSENIW